jgi:hypothetical protein
LPYVQSGEVSVIVSIVVPFTFVVTVLPITINSIVFSASMVIALVRVLTAEAPQAVSTFPQPAYN